MIFFFSSRRRHTRYWRDWSSDVCSSDLPDERPGRPQLAALDQPGPEHQGGGELPGDQHGGARVDGAVGPPRRGVELAQPGVPRAGVVLRGRALAPGPVQALDDERSEEHTSELQSRPYLVCRPLLE